MGKLLGRRHGLEFDEITASRDESRGDASTRWLMAAEARAR